MQRAASLREARTEAPVAAIGESYEELVRDLHHMLRDVMVHRVKELDAGASRSARPGSGLGHQVKELDAGDDSKRAAVGRSAPENYQFTVSSIRKAALQPKPAAPHPLPLMES
jgi:hypothetical protein